jgi:hypothetical protein
MVDGPGLTKSICDQISWPWALSGAAHRWRRPSREGLARSSGIGTAGGRRHEINSWLAATVPDSRNCGTRCPFLALHHQRGGPTDITVGDHGCLRSR